MNSVSSEILSAVFYKKLFFANIGRFPNILDRTCHHFFFSVKEYLTPQIKIQTKLNHFLRSIKQKWRLKDSWIKSSRALWKISTVIIFKGDLYLVLIGHESNIEFNRRTGNEVNWWICNKVNRWKAAALTHAKSMLLFYTRWKHRCFQRI